MTGETEGRCGAAGQMLPNGPPRQRIATVAITRRINYHNHNLSQEQKFHAGGAINRSKVMCNTTICIRSLLYLKELRHKMSSQSRSFAAAHEYLSITTPQNRTVGMPNKERPVGRVCVAPRPSVGGGGGESGRRRGGPTCRTPPEISRSHRRAGPGCRVGSDFFAASVRR